MSEDEEYKLRERIKKQKPVQDQTSINSIETFLAIPSTSRRPFPKSISDYFLDPAAPEETPSCNERSFPTSITGNTDTSINYEDFANVYEDDISATTSLNRCCRVLYTIPEEDEFSNTSETSLNAELPPDSFSFLEELCNFNSDDLPLYPSDNTQTRSRDIFAELISVSTDTSSVWANNELSEFRTDALPPPSASSDTQSMQELLYEQISVAPSSTGDNYEYGPNTISISTQTEGIFKEEETRSPQMSDATKIVFIDSFHSHLKRSKSECDILEIAAQFDKLKMQEPHKHGR